MPAKSKAKIFLPVRIEANPAPDARTGAIGTDNPTRRLKCPSNQHAIPMNARDGRLPAQIHSARGCMIDQNPMQYGASNSIRNALWKDSLNFLRAANKANAMERKDFANWNFNAQCPQGIEPVRHQSLAARFVDRRNRAIRHRHAQAAAACRNSGGQPGGTASGNKNIHWIVQSGEHWT
jgi:hypothetical protein